MRHRDGAGAGSRSSGVNFPLLLPPPRRPSSPGDNLQVALQTHGARSHRATLPSGSSFQGPLGGLARAAGQRRDACMSVSASGPGSCSPGGAGAKSEAVEGDAWNRRSFIFLWFCFMVLDYKRSSWRGECGHLVPPLLNAALYAPPRAQHHLLKVRVQTWEYLQRRRQEPHHAGAMRGPTVLVRRTSDVLHYCLSYLSQPGPGLTSPTTDSRWRRRGKKQPPGRRHGVPV